MPVRIVTDSVSDISPEVADTLGITVVPLNIVIDGVAYRDGVDLTTDEFYRKLERTPVQPTTSDETGDFVKRLGQKYPVERIYLSKVSPVIGTNVGPRVIGVAVLGDT